MRKKDLFRLQQGLQQVGNLKGVKFAYAIAKNSRVIDKEIEDLQKSIEPSEKWAEIEKSQHTIRKKYCKKTPEGEVMPDRNSQYIIPLPLEAPCDKDLDALKNEHKSEYANHEKMLEEYKVLLDTNCIIEFHKVKFDDLPSEITTSQMNGIFEIIE